MISSSQLFKCLADETRLFSTLLIHREEELCVCELMEALALSQPKVSRHLAQLKACNILNDERRGQWVYYSIHPDLPEWARDIIATAQAANSKTMKALLKKLEAMKERPSLC